MDNTIKAIALVPILALSMSAMYFSRMFGLLSPWTSILDVSDYFNKASEFIVFPLIIAAFVIIYAFTPGRSNLSTFASRLAARASALPSKTIIAINLIFASSLVLSIVILPRMYLFLLLGVSIFLFSFIIARSFILGFKVRDVSDSVIILISFAIRLIVIAFLIVEVSVQQTRIAFLTYDVDRYSLMVDQSLSASGAMNSSSFEICINYACAHGELFVDRVAAGVLTYHAGRLSLFSTNGDRLMTQRYKVDYSAMRDSYFCLLFRPMLNLNVCADQLDFYQSLQRPDSAVTP